MTAENVNRLLDCLPDSGLPADLQRWLRELFSHQPVDDLGERDALIRLVVGLSPGESRTARCSFFLDCIGGRLEHPSLTAQGVIKKLRTSGAYVPGSVKQLLRIIEGRRHDGWRTGLCPTVSFLNDGGNHGGKVNGK